MCSSAQVRSAELVSHNLFSSAIAHLRILLIRRDAGFHPGVNFAYFEFPQSADFSGGHFSALDPVKNGITADTQILHDFFHRIPALKVVIHSETPVFTKIQYFKVYYITFFEISQGLTGVYSGFSRKSHELYGISNKRRT